ncbi:MAG: phage major capsid protein [Acidimicrobiia bacterium]|nr:phage major capsid protein [Acidimicrobiia bacterium]
MAIPATLERDVAEARDQIAKLEASAAEKRATAESLVEDEKKAGRNPLSGVGSDDKESFDRIDSAYKEADSDAESAAELRRRLHAMLDRAGGEARTEADGDPSHPKVRAARSVGAMVCASDQYRRLIESGVLSKDTKARIEMSPAQVLDREQAMAFLAHRQVRGDTGDGDKLVPEDQQLLPPVPIPVRMPTVLDMITVGATDSDLIAWTRQTTRTNSADPTAYGTAAPKSRYVWERVETPVKRIPHHVVADKGNLADQAQLRTIIDSELIEDLRLEVENQILSGSGGSGFTGIYNASIGSFDASTATNLADALHKAITVVRVALEREPTGWGISPEDFEDFYLAKGDDGHYLHHRGPTEGQVRTIWGLPAMVSTAYNSAPIVAEWRRLATYWQRSGINVSASDNVDDFFLEELVAILATTRGGFAVRKGDAACEVTNFES